MMELEVELAALRPKLHRYCARMTGSVIDGEDVVQEALLKAVAASGAHKPVGDLERWLFRIAHNAAIDHLRRRARAEAARSSEDPEMLVDPESPVDDPLIVEAGLRTFMRLPVAQRSTVILMDVLGYPLTEICSILEMNLPAVKSALHRGRTRLRELAQEPEARREAELSEDEQARLREYIARFNARDFDAIRELLADEVRLDLPNRVKHSGRTAVSSYFTNYSTVDDWHLVFGLVDGRPAAIVHDPADPSRRPQYFVLLEWAADRLINIRDFRYARYAIDGAEIDTLEPR
jgi:RNA polymerase sigma-70 factor (ECF subfamily)